MPSLPIIYPLINGVRYDHSSVEVKLLGKLFNGIKSIDYSDKLEPGIVRGNRAQVVGRTRGEYNAEGSMEMYAAEYEEFTDLLTAAGAGRGFMEVAFPIACSYAEVGQRTILDALFGCRISGNSVGMSEGGDAATKKVDLHIMRIAWGGKDPLGIRQLLK